MGEVLEIVDERTPELWERQGQGSEVVGVNFPQRRIELVVIPYDVPAIVPHPTDRNAPMVAEVISRGAFNGVETRPNRIKLNREHDVRDTFGVCRALYPSRENGLVADFKVSDTDRGREALRLAADGCLEASAGFNVKQGGWQWEARDQRYRITRAWLRHVALVSEGAYGEHAPVLAVRSQPAVTTADRCATPNADRIRLQKYLDQEAEINARYQARSSATRR
jgi:uncharacterized protein